MPWKSAALGAKKGLVGHTQKGVLYPSAAKLTESINTYLNIIFIFLSYDLIDLKRVHENAPFAYINCTI